MLSLRRVVQIIVAYSILCASAAWAGQHEVGAVALEAPSRGAQPSLQVELSRAPAWQAFQRQHGDWSVEWNEATRTPHRAIGKGIGLAGFHDDAVAVDGAVRRFIADNPSFFAGAPTLELTSAKRGGNLWYVRYRQTLNGIPVLFSDWEFRVSRSGKLVAFGADAQSNELIRSVTPRVHPDEARRAAAAGLGFDPAVDRAAGADQLFYVPRTGRGGPELRLAYSVQLTTTRERGHWDALVDAVTGEVLWRQNRGRHLIQGTVSGPVHLGLPTDPQTTRPFRDTNVNVGGTVVVTDTSGHYEASAGAAVTVSSRMEGPYAKVLRLDGGADAAFSQSNVTDPAVRNIAWTTGNSTDGERNAFYHINQAHAYVKGLDPSFTAMDYQMLAYVNDTGDECSAYWDGTAMALFFTESSPNCPNTATMGEIVFHEYSHAVEYNAYFANGAPFGLTNVAMAEGLADAFVALATDDPIIGEGFDGPGTFLRDISIDKVWPEDATPSAHTTGLILAGALWDLRQSTSLGLAATLRHFAMYGIPDDANDGVAMNEFFVEVLLADDDDANLSNGTPHFDQIVTAFNAHGIGTGYFLNITHTPLDDQPTFGPFPISAIFQYSGPVGALDVNSPTLYYSMNGGPFLAELMFPTGNPDEWGGQVPQVSGAIVSYYMRAADTYGAHNTEPGGAPIATHVFVAGPASPFLFDDMETNPGWTVGAAGDDAISGIWVIDDPMGTQAQPADDHTPQPGTMCYFTGQADSTLFPGVNDVDGGKTTLTTTSFDAVLGGAVSNPIISYYRWYSNNTGDAPNEDVWQVDISNDGGSSWTPVENTTESNLTWQRVVFFIQNYIAPTNDMKVRFVASDEGNPSLVEAAVDDFSMLAYPSFVSVGETPTVTPLSLAPAAPNPFARTTTLHYTLPAAAHVSLSIFDISGRSIRKLVHAEQSAGPHSVEWDGRDAVGHRVPSGPYFVRLMQNGQQATQAVVRIQ